MPLFYLIIVFNLISVSEAYTQEITPKEEIYYAIENATKGQFEISIPIFEKYLNYNLSEEHLKFMVYTYVNFCYQSTNKDKIELENLNEFADKYLQSNSHFKTDSPEFEQDMSAVLILGYINYMAGNNEKAVFYLNNLKNEIDSNSSIFADVFCFKTLYYLSLGYNNIKRFDSAMTIGELALQRCIKVYGKESQFTITILEFLSKVSSDANRQNKVTEYSEKEAEIGRTYWGESDTNYLKVLNRLFFAYYNSGDYKKSLKILEEKSESIKKVFGEKHQFYLTCLSNKALVLSALGNYQESLEIDAYVTETLKELLNERNPEYLLSLNNLALDYFNLGMYLKAKDLLLGVIVTRKEVLGEQNPDYLTSLNNLASVYSALGNYQDALEIKQKVVELSKEILGDNHPDYLLYLSNLGMAYLDLGNYQKALEINLMTSELRKEILGEKHPDYLTSLNNLASVYSALGNYQDALEIKQKVVELSKDILGDKHPDYLLYLSNLDMAYLDLGNYQKALEINMKVAEIRKEILGVKHPDYLTSLSNLAMVYSDMGNYQQALEINLKVADIRKEILGVRHPDYLMSLCNLAAVYSAMGNYQQALEINMKVAEIGKDVFGEKHPYYLTSLNNLATVYSDMGNYQQALEINIKVAEIKKNVLGEKHPDYLTSLNNLASDYWDLGNYPKALELNMRVAEIRKDVLGDKHPDYLTSLNNLATDYCDLGNYQKALEINIKVAEIRKDVLGDKHPDYLTSLNNLATVYGDLGNYQKALEINMKVAEIRKDVLGEKHPDYLISLNNMAIDEFKLSKFNSALYHKRNAAQVVQELIIENFSFLTENQRELFFKRYRSLLMYSTLLVENSHLDNPESVCFVFDLALFSKGLLLNTTIDFDKLIAEKGTTEAIAKFEELKLLKLEIQRLWEKPIAERYLNIDSLENIAQQKETELVKLSKEYGDYTSNMKINWNDVQANLQEKDVAIEFVEYPTLTDTVKYAALILRKGWKYPKFIPLFRKDQIEEFIKKDKNIIYSKYVGKQIKNLIWSPLESVVSRGERVYFSPAGIIHQLAIENLPVDDSTTLGDRYQMNRLSSTKQLVVSHTHDTARSDVLYGGLNYSLDIPVMMTESKKYEFETSSNYLARRGYQNDTKDRIGWKFLQGTKPEVDQISRIMKQQDYQVSEFTGKNGNEESFKSLSGKKENIIHIATHGFFESIEESRKNPFMLQRMGDQQQERATVDPMLRSGLIMAGGNKAWLGEKIPENIEDGVLTAREISRMDLRGTDLVVLSACETGLGEVSSEGVFGLQRSFKQAGVRTLVMSLWEVSDKATTFIMTEFYSNLLSGKEKREAFLEAKRKCKVKFPEPQYWAAFIMLD